MPAVGQIIVGQIIVGQAVGQAPQIPAFKVGLRLLLQRMWPFF